MIAPLRRRAPHPFVLALCAALLFLAACEEESYPTNLPVPPEPSISASPGSLTLQVEAGGETSEADTVAVSYEDLDARPALSVEGDTDLFGVEQIEEAGTPEEGTTRYSVVFNAPASVDEDDLPAVTLSFSGGSAEVGEEVSAEVAVTGRIGGEPSDVALSRLAPVADFEPRGEGVFGTFNVEGGEIVQDVADGSNGVNAQQITAVTPAEGDPGAFYNRRANLPDADRFSLFVKGDPANPFDLFFLFEEDDTGDNGFNFDNDDQFAYTLTVEAGDEWRRYEVPFSALEDNNDGGNGAFDPVAERSGGNGGLVGVVPLVRNIPDGQSVTFALDELAFGDASGALVSHADFEQPSLVYEFVDNEDNGQLTVGALTDDVPAGSDGYNAQTITTTNVEGTSGFGFNYNLINLPTLGSDGTISFYVKAPAAFDLRILLEETDGGAGQDQFVFTQPVEGDDEWAFYEIEMGAFEDANDAGDGTLNPVAERSGGNGGFVNVGFEIQNVSEEAGGELTFLIDEILLRSAGGAGGGGQEDIADPPGRPN